MAMAAGVEAENKGVADVWNNGYGVRADLIVRLDCQRGKRVCAAIAESESQLVE
jgi:hypothetical protein